MAHFHYVNVVALNFELATRGRFHILLHPPTKFEECSPGVIVFLFGENSFMEHFLVSNVASLNLP
jgi:hypothetical protein